MPMPQPNLIYLNGKYLSPDSPEAKISPFDRGFLFGDSAYEVMVMTDGKIVQANDHFNRLARSLTLMQMSNPHTQEEYEHIAQKLFQGAKAKSKSFMLYLQVSRGLNREEPFYRQVPYSIDSNTLTPTVFMYLSPLTLPKTPEEYARVKLKIFEDIRWRKCEIKSTNLLPNAMIRSEAEQYGCYDGLLIQNSPHQNFRQSKIIECAGNNIFIIKNNEILTPPEAEFMLPGTLRRHILRLAHTLNIPCHEKTLTLEDAFNADEIWACCTTRDILPVTHLVYSEGGSTQTHPIGTGEAGPLWGKMIFKVLEFRQNSFLSPFAKEP
jgi:D-alanine transaminase